MAMVYNDKRPTGGQVPLLKHAIMQWLLAQQNEHGYIRGDSYDVVKHTRASVPNVARALWDLQKAGLVTFNERKRQGTNGHASTTVLQHFTLTPTGLKWTAEKAFVDDMAHIDSMTMQDVNPSLRDEIDAQDMATEIQMNVSPPQALANLLKRTPSRSLKVLRANDLLGYAHQSTAIYALKKAYPAIFKIESGRVYFTGPEDWKAPTGIGHGRNRAPNIMAAVQREAEASVALDHDDKEGTHYVGDGHPHDDPTTGVGQGGEQAVSADGSAPSTERLPLPLGPEITALLARAERRAKVAEAVAALEAAGLDDDALTVMGRIPDDSPLEQEVLALLDWVSPR
jgi:DNA-binding PadR family transcriptional regulator